jgi:predicted transcriptional regulator
MTDEEKIITWLKEHDLIKHLALERKCGMPQGCLYKIIHGKIEFPPHHIPTIAKQLKPYGFSLNSKQQS